MEKRKTYVLDTTVLIHDPDVFYKLGDADIVIPLAVIRELDGLKNSDSELVAKAARQVSRILDRISSYSDMREAGGNISSGARIFIETHYEKIEGLDSEGDRQIIGTALYLKKKGVENLLLATTDTNMRIVGRTYGLKAEHMPDYFVERDPVMEMDINMNSPVINSKIAKNNTFTKTLKTISWFILTIFISILVLLAITQDTVSGLLLGLIIGGMVFMSGYALYLRRINRNIPYDHLPYRTKCYNHNSMGNNSTDLWDTPFSGNPYFDSTNRGN